MDGRLIIANRRIDTEEKIDSINPANLESIGEVSLASEKECQQALQVAKDSFSIWKELSPADKRRIFQVAKKNSSSKKNRGRSPDNSRERGPLS